MRFFRPIRLARRTSRRGPGQRPNDGAAVRRAAARLVDERAATSLRDTEAVLREIAEGGGAATQAGSAEARIALIRRDHQRLLEMLEADEVLLRLHHRLSILARLHELEERAEESQIPVADLRVPPLARPMEAEFHADGADLATTEVK